MNDLTKLTITQALEGLKSKKFSAVDLTKAYLENMKKRKNLNAYVLELAEVALENAKISDQKYADGTNRKLEGLPLGIKDLFCTKGIETTACSNILKGFVPEYESTVTQKLLDEGAIFLGKLNMDEFAMGGSNETSCFGTVINPWCEEKNLIAGGSSGGSAAAVSANMCIAATGSDTGGSTRQPASYCGLVGIKPTYGRCSRYGMVAYASSLDQAGIIAKNVADAAILLEVICGYDEKDSTTAKVEVPNFSSLLDVNLKGLKVGVVKEYIAKGLSDDVLSSFNQCVSELKQKGAEIVEICLPTTKYALPAYYTIAPAEASANLSRYDGVRYGLRVDAPSLDEMYVKTRTAGFGDEVKRRVMIGTYILSAQGYDIYYLKAQKVRRLISDDFAKAFESCDVILSPTTQDVAHENGKKLGVVESYLNDVFTVPVNLAGLPAISFPFSLSKDGLPIGLQLIGKSFDEALILGVASKLEKEMGK